MNKDHINLVPLYVDITKLKSLQEALNVATNLLTFDSRYSHYAKYLAHLNSQTYIYRPVGSNGKHGNMHTESCGCEDSNEH